MEHRTIAPGADDVDARGLDSTLRFQRGSGPDGTFTWVDLDSVDAFREQFSRFYDAARQMSHLWENVAVQQVAEAQYPPELGDFQEVVTMLAGWSHDVLGGSGR